MEEKSVQIVENIFRNELCALFAKNKEMKLMMELVQTEPDSDFKDSIMDALIREGLRATKEYAKWALMRRIINKISYGSFTVPSSFC